MTVRTRAWLKAQFMERDPNDFIADVVDTFGGADALQGSTAYYVDSTNAAASDSNPGTDPDAPLATLDGAFGVSGLTAGDVIFLMPGHSETKAAAGSLFAADVAGVFVIGLGNGASRPTFTFSHTGAVATISGAGIVMHNVLFVAGVDLVAAPLTISAADVKLHAIEWRDTTDIEFISPIITTAAADRLEVSHCLHNGYAGGDACLTFAKLVGCDGGFFHHNRYLGKYDTAIIQFHTTAATGFRDEGSVFLCTGTALTKNIVDTVGGSTWSASGFDMVANAAFSGGNGVALAADDVSAVGTAVATVSGAVSGLTSSHVVVSGVESGLVSSHAVVSGTLSGLVSSHAVVSGVESGLVSSHVIVSGTLSGLVSSHAVVSAVESGLTSSHAIVSGSLSELISSHVIVSGTLSGLVSSDVVVSGSLSGLVSSDVIVSGSLSGLTSSHAIVSGSLSDLVSSHTIVSTTLSTILSYLVSGW